jgi:hypothetical protein
VIALAMALGEDLARRAGAVAQHAAEWRTTPPSDAQLAALRRWGCKAPATRGEAADKLTTTIAGRNLRDLGLASSARRIA